MIRIVASAACAAALAGAAPVLAQIAPTAGVGAAQVNRAIPGTPGSPGTIVNPGTGAQSSVPRATAPPRTYHDGLSSLTTPSVDAANRPNGVVGQAGVRPVAGVNGVRAVGAAPLSQRGGATRPTLTWQP